MSSTKQKGAVLVVALILLLVVTLLGAAVMQGGSLEMKMANNSQERQIAFNAAEYGLRQAEIFISNSGKIKLSDVKNGCSGTNCFNSSCTNGLCFFGTTTVGAPSATNCTIAPVAGPSALGPWEDPTLNVWNTATKNKTYTLPGSTNPVKVIIEYRCWIDDVAGNVFTDALYRITARGKSPSGRVEVMLQSTYRATAPL